MTEDMLNDPDATHSKPVENFFGNIDRELKKSGPQGFDKCACDLVIKYSTDLISDDDYWKTKANRAAAKKLKVIQKQFDSRQEELIKSGVDKADAANICTSNKVIKCIAKCKESHDGPIVTTEELHKMVSKKKDDNGEGKDLHKALNLEIRFRKLTLTEVKTTCPLFRQKGLSVAHKVKNLESLIESQLDFKVLADMDDLESAIDNAEQAQIQKQSFEKEEVEQSVSQDKSPTKPEKSSDNLPTTAPSTDHNICVGEFVLGLFDDGFYPAEVILIDDDDIEINCQEPAIIRGERNFQFWKWISAVETETISSLSVLPIRPVLDVDEQYTSSRNVVFQLCNYELIKNLVD